MSAPEFDGPVLSLPIMNRMRDEYGDGPMRDVRDVVQNALHVLIERLSRYTDDAYAQGLRDGFMQGCLASEEARSRAKDNTDPKDNAS